jgi:hypothetical protein
VFINAFGGKKGHKQMDQPFLTRSLFYAEGVLKSHEVRNFGFSFFIFHFYFLILFRSLFPDSIP